MSDKRAFQVDIKVYGENIGYMVIELAQAVIDAVDDNWRKSFYDLYTTGEIAEHIAANMFENHLRLSQMDGWADQPDSNAKMIEWPDIYYRYEGRELK